MNKCAIAVIAKNANDALTGGTCDISNALRAKGIDVDIIDFRVPENVQRMAKHIADEDILFGFGLQGIGSRLVSSQGKNLWHEMKVPFVCVHYDHPCWNPSHHYSDSPFVGNMYRFSSFLGAREKYLPKKDQLSIYQPLDMQMRIEPENQIPFEKRPWSFLFIKTGYSLDELYRQIDAAPQELATALRAVIFKAKVSADAELCDLVAEAYASVSIDVSKSLEAFWEHVKLVDKFIRQERAIRFVNWLKTKQNALIIGDGWDFIDKSNALATFRPAASSEECYPLYSQARFVCNTNPYGADIVHERIVAGLMNGACVITDGNSWLDNNFADVEAVLRFDWNRALADQLDDKVADMIEMAEAARHGRAALLDRIKGDNADSLINFVSKITDFAVGQV